ncbi:MAG: hypothetical protein HKN12_05145 [Gemmatimonadetes bacterium]|nr:hypothetical protein [Gemmatimonadota bacterium]
MKRICLIGWGTLTLALGACASTPAPGPESAAAAASAPSETRAAGGEVAPLREYRTSDGFTLAADLDVPAAGNAPLVVLGHQVGRDRRSWDLLVPRLVDAGYAVIRMDHRGFGESTREVPSPSKLTNEHKWGLYLDLADAIDAAAAHPGVDADRVAVIGTGLSVNAAVECWEQRPEVEALVLMSGVIQKAQVLSLMERTDLPLLLVAAGGHDRDSQVMSRYEGRFLGPAQRYIEFEPVDETDDAKWQGTDGLNDRSGLPELIVWFLQENFPAD